MPRLYAQPPGPDGESPRPAYLFVREGEYWTITFDETVGRFRHARGFQHLARLLGAPGTPIPASALAGEGRAPVDASGGSWRTGRREAEREDLAVEAPREVRWTPSPVRARNQSASHHFYAALRVLCGCGRVPRPMHHVSPGRQTDRASERPIETPSD